MKPVPIAQDEYWTDDLTAAIGWYLTKTEKPLYGGMKEGFVMRRKKK
jgi:hypothetical protein